MTLFKITSTYYYYNYYNRFMAPSWRLEKWKLGL